MADPTCVHCKYFRFISKIPPIKGECHYNPPSSDSIFKTGMNVNARVAVWPVVREVDFCAKFEEGTAPSATKAMPKPASLQ